MSIIQIRSLKISKTAKLLLYIIQEVEAEAGEAVLSLTQLSDMGGSSRNTISESIKSLEEMGLLQIIRGVGRESNKYHVLK